MTSKKLVLSSYIIKPKKRGKALKILNKYPKFPIFNFEYFIYNTLNYIYLNSSLNRNKKVKKKFLLLIHQTIKKIKNKFFFHIDQNQITSSTVRKGIDYAHDLFYRSFDVPASYEILKKRPASSRAFLSDQKTTNPTIDSNFNACNDTATTTSVAAANSSALINITSKNMTKTILEESPVKENTFSENDDSFNLESIGSPLNALIENQINSFDYNDINLDLFNSPTPYLYET